MHSFEINITSYRNVLQVRNERELLSAHRILAENLLERGHLQGEERNWRITLIKILYVTGFGGGWNSSASCSPAGCMSW
jgi:hypothetical protein